MNLALCSTRICKTLYKLTLYPEISLVLTGGDCVLRKIHVN